MFGVNDLNEVIEKDAEKVGCPVRGCKQKVERQRKVFRREDKFKCKTHNIYISPSTFEYENKWINILWRDPQDKIVLENIMATKRESRIARDNSEDAVTWNVFRYLEKENLIENYLGSIVNDIFKSSDCIYWSFHQKEGNSWSELNKAREEFGEQIQRSSEPDLIIKTDKALFFIEAKLTASNKTIPSDRNNAKKYKTGGNEWFSSAFRSDYNTIAIDEKKYELLRLWLLGSWIADRNNLSFYLMNLVPEDKERKIEDQFKEFIIENEKRSFKRMTWEDIYKFVKTNQRHNLSWNEITEYFENKTIGYGSDGRIRKAFTTI